MRKKFFGKLCRRSRIKHDNRARRVRARRSSRYSRNRRLKLHEKNLGLRDIVQERRDVVDGKRAVRAERDGNYVLPLFIDEDKRRSRSVFTIDDKLWDDSIAAKPVGCLVTENVVTDFGNELASLGSA